MAFPKCDFYGSYEVQAGTLRKAQCPTCHAVRTLQQRSGGFWFFPQHDEILGSPNAVEYLVFDKAIAKFVEVASEQTV